MLGRCANSMVPGGTVAFGPMAGAVASALAVVAFGATVGTGFGAAGAVAVVPSTRQTR